MLGQKGLHSNRVLEKSKKRATGTNSLSHFKAREKKTRWNLNSLSSFQAHEKEVHPDPTRSLVSKLVKKRPVGVLIRFLVFKHMKKRFTRTSTCSLISRLVKKRPIWVLIRFLISELMKKRSTRTSFLIFVYERHQSHYASAFDSCCYFTLVFS